MSAIEFGVVTAMVAAISGLIAGVVGAVNSWRQGKSAARKDDLDALRTIIDDQADSHALARDSWRTERADLSAKMDAQAKQHAIDRAADREMWERERAQFSARLDAQAMQHAVDRAQWHAERAELLTRIKELEKKNEHPVK